jgi:hypothetical protein
MGKEIARRIIDPGTLRISPRSGISDMKSKVSDLRFKMAVQQEIRAVGYGRI